MFQDKQKPFNIFFKCRKIISMKQTAEFDCWENKRNRINYYFFN